MTPPLCSQGIGTPSSVVVTLLTCRGWAERWFSRHFRYGLWLSGLEDPRSSVARVSGCTGLVLSWRALWKYLDPMALGSSERQIQLGGRASSASLIHTIVTLSRWERPSRSFSLALRAPLAFCIPWHINSCTIIRVLAAVSVWSVFVPAVFF